MGLFRKARHESGNAYCSQCPQNWPQEHKNCGGLFHVDSRVKPSQTVRVGKCDKCNQMIELLLVGNIGSVQARPEDLAEAERQAFEMVTGESESNSESAGAQDVMNLVVTVPAESPRPPATFEDADSVFAGRNINYCIEKLYDYIHHPHSSIASHIAEFGWEQIVTALRDFEAKVRACGANPDHSDFPTALHAAMELQQYVSKQKCCITSEIEARIYLQSLKHDLDELRQWERDLDEVGADPAPETKGT
jgi:hypothetical protein